MAPSPLINVASNTKSFWNLNSQHLKGEREGEVEKVQIVDKARTQGHKFISLVVLSRATLV